MPGRNVANRPPPPAPADDWALFLDVDGCLLDLAEQPDAVRVPSELRHALRLLADRLEGALALVSAYAFRGPDPFDKTREITTLVFADKPIDAAAANALRVATPFLDDHAYDDEGLLVPRRLPNAVIHDEAEVLARVRQLLADGTVTSRSGKLIAMRPRSILVHGDTPGALALARTLRREIEGAGGRIVPLSQQFARAGSAPT